MAVIKKNKTTVNIPMNIIFCMLTAVERIQNLNLPANFLNPFNADLMYF